MAALLSISKAAESIIKQELERTFPDEGCGFLFGSDGDVRKITLAQPVENTKQGDKRRRFEIAPLDYIKAERFALENGLNLLGIFHSHPNHPAIPSVHDLAQAVPYFSYLIASVYDGKLKEITSWKLEETINEFEEEKFLITQTNSSN